MPAQSGPRAARSLIRPKQPLLVWIPLTIFGTKFATKPPKTTSMRTFIFAIFTLLFSTPFLKAQTDATALLDKLNKKTKAYTSLEAAFTFSVLNTSQKVNEVRKGTIKLKGEKYVLKMGEMDIFCNGKTVYTYSKEMNEAQVIPVAELDDDAMTPQNMFSIYEKGFKSKIKSSKTEGGKKITSIELYPTQPKEKDYTMVKMDVDETSMQIKRVEVMGKNGTKYIYAISSFAANKAMADADFEFQKANYPGVSILD
jgi:outer membrane lipoprotein-sorting protein